MTLVLDLNIKLVPHHESEDKFKPLEENMNSGDKLKYKNKFLI